MDWSRPSGVVGNLKRRFSPRNAAGVVAILVSLTVAFSTLSSTRRSTDSLQSKACGFPAIFNFGDSNSDTGGKSAAFHRLQPPNGDTFFGKTSGRYCDGKVILDFIAEKLGLPYLSPYLDSMGTNFCHGANFATGGSTIQPLDTRIFEAGFSPISLDIQLSQFEQFKARTLELHADKSYYAKSSLPRPEDFSKALYTLDIGQNDLHAALSSMTEKQALASIPSMMNKFSVAVERLYQQGARAFWIHNTGPIGCLPYDVITYPPESNNTDENGCVASHNRIAQEFNMQLKALVSKLRLHLLGAVLNYIDIYSAKNTLISEAQKHGFVGPLEYCCGHHGDYTVQCGEKAIVNGTEVFGASCGDPLKVISWDGGHYSHAANQWVSKRVVDGSLSDIQVPLPESCGESLRS
ncbi:Lipase_GDSL domain-containing protein [Psidium guajava]|nr:Lipase_GDSL domain-containing protein [Psidium guajava]